MCVVGREREREREREKERERGGGEESGMGNITFRLAKIDYDETYSHKRRK